MAALNYSVPQLIRSAAAKIYGTDSEAALNVLDAGCGTGLCAKLLSEILPHAAFFGVDLSVRMIMEARKKTFINNCLLMIWSIFPQLPKHRTI